MSDDQIEGTESLFCDLCPSDENRPQPCRPWEEKQYSNHLKVVHECEFCGMLCQTEQTRVIHWWRIHGKRYRLEAWFKIVGDEAVEQFGRFVDVDGWQAPVEGNPDVPTEPERFCNWIFPMCIQLLKYTIPEKALFMPSPNFSSQALYVETYFRTVKAVVNSKRFNRLKTLKPRAELMAKALAMPDCSPGYAEQQLRGIIFDHV